MELPILYYDVDGTQVFRNDLLAEVFEKVGSRSFAVLSVNGMRQTGKSSLLTQILRYLSPELPEIEWNTTEDEPSIGICVWSEPILVRNDSGHEQCLILLKTKTSLEPPATLEQNATVSALSLCLSSLLILNLRKSITKESLTFLQYFLNLAKSLQESGTFERNFKFQRILFLVRDMDLRVKDFAHGYHTPTYKPPPTAHSQTNLFTQIFSIDPTRQPLEVQHTYRQVLSAFHELGLFALPERSPIATGRERTLELEFQNYVQMLLDLLVGGESGLVQSECNRVNSLTISGHDFIDVIDLWHRRLKRTTSAQNDDMFGGQGHQSRAEILNRIATSNLLSLYVSTISDFLAEHGRRTGKSVMYSKTLAEKMNSFLKICLDTFSRRLSQGDDNLKVKYREILSGEIEMKMKLFESLNESRLKYGREVGVLRAEATGILEQLDSLRLQRDHANAEQDGRADDQLERSLRAVQDVHIRKQTEEFAGRLVRIEQKIEETQQENEKSLDQIVNLIHNMSFY